jgi:DNA-binding LytR/AlgR family response regulator
VNLLIPAVWWLGAVPLQAGAWSWTEILAASFRNLHANALVYICVAGATEVLLRSRSRSNRPGQFVTRLTARLGSTVTLVDVDHIDWIAAADDYARVHSNGSRLLVAERMLGLEQRLDPSRFVRVHRSALVNISRVRRVLTNKTATTLVLRDGTEVRVSRTRRKAVLELLERHSEIVQRNGLTEGRLPGYV